jgi:hypothetical protein
VRVGWVGWVCRVVRAEWATKSRGGACFIGPGVVGEPLGGDKVLAAAVGGVHVAPLGPSAVHRLAVALDDISTVSEGEAGALAATVGVGGGGLGLGVQGIAMDGGEGHGGQEGEEDEHCHKCAVG